MKFDGEIIKFNIFDAMRSPTDVNCADLRFGSVCVSQCALRY